VKFYPVAEIYHPVEGGNGELGEYLIAWMTRLVEDEYYHASKYQQACLYADANVSRRNCNVRLAGFLNPWQTQQKNCISLSKWINMQEHKANETARTSQSSRR
jgi:hypothetical protein